MDALLVLGFLVALAVAAPIWGVDSRPGVSTKESDLAVWGVTWEAGTRC